MLLSDRFDFKETYWYIAGIAGINPYEGTLGSVAVSRFAIQVALQQELDAREKPDNWTTGCKHTRRRLEREAENGERRLTRPFVVADWAQNTDGPGLLPAADTLYGTAKLPRSCPGTC